MSKPSTATTPKNSAQLSSRSAWSKGPPSSASSPRSQSPAPSPTTPVNPTHSRRGSNLSQSVITRDGVSVPIGNASVVKQGPGVTFGSINDDSASIPSSQVAPLHTKKADGVKSFGSLPASTTGQANGSSGPNTPSKSSFNSTTPSSGPSTPKITKMDVSKLFQGSGSSTAPASSTPPDTASPSLRPSGLPPSAHGSHPSHTPPNQPYPNFVPGGNRLQNASGPGGGGPGAGPPRSPVLPRQVANGAGRGNGSHPSPAPPSQMPAAMPSPRLGPHHPGQPHGMPPAQPAPMPPQWNPAAGYYYAQPGPEMYIPYPAYPWPYPTQPPLTHPHQTPPVPQGITMSPRVPPQPLQGVPGTPNPHLHQLPPPAQPLTHSTSNSISSPPATPSSNPPRLNMRASAFVPKGAKVVIRNPDGKEINFSKSSPAPHTSPLPASPRPGHASAANRRSVRMESEEQRKKRIAEEEEEAKEREKIEKMKKDSKEKAKREEEERERKAKEAEERKVKAAEAEKIKKEEEAKERIKQEQERIRKAEEEEKERKAQEERERKAEEERVRKEEEEKERLRKEEEEKERLRKAEEEERQRKEEEQKRLEEERQRTEAEETQRAAEEAEKAKQAEGEPAAAKTSDSPSPEEGEVVQEPERDQPSPATQSPTKAKDGLRIDTGRASPTTDGRKRPIRLDLSSTKGPVTPALPSALATARNIDDISEVSYPEGIQSPKVELNINSKNGKFRYDREFLLQFMSICKEKPDMLPPLDAIGLEPSDQAYQQGRNTSRRQASTPVISRHGGLSNFPPPPFPKSGTGSFNAMGQFQVTQDRYNIGRSVSTSGGQQSQFRPSPMVRTPSQSGSISGSGRSRSSRGHKRDRDAGGKSGGNQHGHGSALSQGSQVAGMEPVAPLVQSANAWAPVSTRRGLAVDPDSPEYVNGKVRSLLNKMAPDTFDSISDQVISWANKSENEKDGRTLIQVIGLVFEKATDEAHFSEMYARLCRKMMERVSPKVQDDGIKNNDGKPIAGGQLFRKYLLNRCQEDFERGWAGVAAAAKTIADEMKATSAANGKPGTDGEVTVFSDEYYAAQKAKRRGLGLIRFIGELFKLQMLTERIMHECVKKLLSNVENPEEEEIESLCKLLLTVGSILDNNKARAHMDVYFTRMKELCKSPNVSSRIQFMLQDVIELRERGWVARMQNLAPTTIAQVHEAAKKAHEKEAMQRQMSMSRGGSRRGGDRSEIPQADGWAVAGGAGQPRQASKAGDLSNFGKISKPQMSFGPSSIFAAAKNQAKDGKRESSLSRTNSSSNMFSMLSQSAETTADPSTSKANHPSSRKGSVDLAGAEGGSQRKKLMLLPRSIPTPEDSNPVTASDPPSEDEPLQAGMSEADAKKKIEEDLKEFLAVRSLDEADEYLPHIPSEHQFLLIEKFVGSAIESKEADAELVGSYFSRAAEKGQCSPEAFEKGFLVIAEFLDDIAIDAPKAVSFFAIMLKGSKLDNEACERIAGTVGNPSKLLGFLS